MPETLPAGWVQTTLGGITQPSRERALPTEPAGMRYVGLEHIEAQSMKLLGYGQATDARSSSVRFFKGDVLYAKMRPYLNKVWVAEFDGICSAEFLVFPNREGINSRFLAARLNMEDFVEFANEQVSGDRPRVDFEKLSRFPVLLPPTAEQDRIVAKLDASLSGIDRAEAAMRRAGKRLQHYRTAVLHAAVTGELTRDWRRAQPRSQKGPPKTGNALLTCLLAVRRTRWEEANKDSKRKAVYREPTSPRTDNQPKLPEGWAYASLDQIGELNRGKSKHRPRDDARLYGGSYPFIQTGDIRRSDGTILQHTQTYSEFGLSQSRLWPAGTLCITIAANIAETAILSYPACFPDSVVGFVQNDTLLNVRFVELFIRSEKSELEQYAPATAQKNINLAFLQGLAIPLPPLTEQSEVVREVEHRLSAASRLAATLEQQSVRAHTTRQLLLGEAFTGRLVPQRLGDEPASALLDRILVATANATAKRPEASGSRKQAIEAKSATMPHSSPSPETLTAAWHRIGESTDARRLFNEAGLVPEQVVQFYEALRATPELRAAFQAAAQGSDERRMPISRANEEHQHSVGRFRLVELWLEDFKNLRNYTVKFDPTQGTAVVLGWNGTGKSNLFEALVIILRELHDWWERNRWPDKPMNGFRLVYEIDEHTVEVNWQPARMRRPELKRAAVVRNGKSEIAQESLKREDLPLPRFIFGYYSGPTNRLAEHFLPMKQAHYDRLRQAEADDAETPAALLAQRRFFCAETHHAKYVLLGFSYKEDAKISEFLENRLRILGFESALFIIRKPPWARSGSKAENFWGAGGIMRRVMERLRRYAIAPMIVEQRVSYGYRTATEDHYYFFLPDIESLHSFAAEYQDARTFFLALESTDFSELIHDVKIQVRVKSTNAEEVPITFHQLSEGEQQLLMVLGLMRFTKSHQSLVLLDEPDTHLNPHWSVDYLKDLARVMSDDAVESTEQQTSQILMATHDPLVIASLVKEQVHLLKRDPDTRACTAEFASVNPRGLGFTGILTSDMFGFRSDLDPETLGDLDNRVRLVAQEGALSQQEREELEEIDKRLAAAGFSKAFSDPYYAAFVRAWGRKYSDSMAGQQFLTPEKRQEIDSIATEVLQEAIAEVGNEVKG